MTRRKCWSDRNYAEEWEWGNEHVLRFRALASYPWKYLIGEFTKAHEPFAERRDRPMTSQEIRDFKQARSVI